MKKIFKGTSAILLFFILMIGGYVAYMQSNYYRIEDNLVLDISNNIEEILEVGRDYSAVTYNIGFGAYEQDYSFFMDTGTMKDGTQVKGKSSVAKSLDSAKKNTNGSIETVGNLEADFVLLQEVDVKATRSYGINQKDDFETEFSNYASIFASNFHSAYMIYPFHEPHGSVSSGLLTLSKYKTDSATRISYPVTSSFVTKFTDLDRCFSITRLPVSNGKELVLINNHMSAYDEGGTMRAEQLKLLNETMKNEYEKGNYVIVGGDFNHVLNISDDLFESKQEVPDWIFRLTNEDLVQGMSIVDATNNTEVPTCRSTDIPYEKGVNYISVIDGFIVSDNVIATSENIDEDFLYSDHNPVKLTFQLK